MIRFLLRRAIAKFLDPFPRLSKNLCIVNDYQSLQMALGWEKYPDFADEKFKGFRNSLDINFRRLHDAEMLMGACCNIAPNTIVEIGTAHGHMTYLMSINAPQATIHTVNLPPEEKYSGGNHITFAPERSDIGRIYREKGCENVKQIIENSSNWKPELESIDVAFIDGCHDSDYVFNDTLKILRYCKPGSIIVWHDFSPPLIYRHKWIGSVCHGVERLLKEKYIKGNIFYLKDSLVGMYVVGDNKDVKAPPMI